MSYKKSHITTGKTHNSRAKPERVPLDADDGEGVNPEGPSGIDGDGAEAELAEDPSVILKRRGNDESKTVQKVKKKPIQTYGPSHKVEHPSSPFTLYMSNNNKKLLRKVENKLTKCTLKDRKLITYISQRPQLNVSRKA
jgi:hypothetical protein